MSYNPYYDEWKDSEAGGTPINAAALNTMDDGIAANADAITALIARVAALEARQNITMTISGTTLNING